VRSVFKGSARQRELHAAQAAAMGVHSEPTQGDRS